jgi:tRNA 2-thiouridine synthesizing protein A
MTDNPTDISQIDIAVRIDATGLFCPEPVMMLHSHIRDIAVGQVMELIATDPSTQRDVPKFCLFLGHELMLAEEDESTFRFLLRKSG